MPVLDTFKFDKDPIKNDWEKVEIMSMGVFGCHVNRSFDLICPKT